MTKKEVIVPADDLVCLGKDKLQELIRCKDCIYWNYEDSGTDGTAQGKCFSLGVLTDGMYYCADAERREKDNG